MSNLLTLDRLIVNQKAKLIEVTQEYAIRDENGDQVGYIRQEGQSTLHKAARFLTSIDQFLTHHFALYDDAGTKILELSRPAKFVKSRIVVKDGNGQQLGQIVQKNVFGKIRFDLEASDGQLVGQIRAENWRAWNFAIVDPNEREVARITKKFVGVTKAVFTPADNYIVDIDHSVEGLTRLFVLASATAVDTALKQDARGIDFT